MARRASVFVRQSNAVSNKQMWSFLTLVDSTLCGMVALCAGCNIIETYGAFVIGVLAAFVYMGTEKLLHKFLIDDPLGLS
jgi:Amt family ammonium transporter